MKDIFSIIKKELRLYFNNPTAYIVMLVFLLLWEFLFFRNVFLIGQASLATLFSFLPWLFLMIVPALTMGSVAQEKSEGTIEFLLTRSVKESKILWGKFFASLIFMAGALAFSLPLAWSLNKFGNLDWGVFWGQYLASVLMSSALISLGIFISGFFRSQISALLTTLVFSFLLIIAGTSIFTLRLPFEIALVFEQLSILTHFESMARGVIDFRDVWYFLSLTVAFLVLANFHFLKRRFGNKKKAYRNYQLAMVIFLAIVLVSNVLGYNISGRIDLTEGKRYTLSQTSKDVLDSLDDVVNITLFTSDKLPAQLQPTARELEDILNDYKTLGKGNVIVEKKNPSKDPSLKELASSMGIQEVRFNVVSDEEFQVKTGYLGVSVAFGSEYESIPFVENTGSLEYQLTSFIKQLGTDEKSKIVSTQGHGEKVFNQQYTLLKKELEKQFETDLLIDEKPTEEGDEESETTIESAASMMKIEEDTDVLVVSGISEEVDDNFKNEFKNYIASGGSALLLLDGVNINQQSFSATVNESNFLDFVKDEYGVEAKKNLVYDLRSYESVVAGQGGMSYILPYPLWLKAFKTQSNHPVINEIDSISFPWTSSLQVSEKEGIEIEELIKTSPYAGVQSVSFDISLDQDFSQSDLSERLLMVSVKVQGNDGKEGRLLITANSGFFSDEFTQNHPTNIALGLEAISWLAQEDSLAQIQLKNSVDRTLLFEKDSQISVLKFGNLAFAGIAPSAYGFWRLSRRRKKRNDSYNA